MSLGFSVVTEWRIVFFEPGFSVGDCGGQCSVSLGSVW